MIRATIWAANEADDRQQIAGPVVLQQQREEHRGQAEHHQLASPRYGKRKFHCSQRRFIDAAGVTGNGG